MKKDWASNCTANQQTLYQYKLHKVKSENIKYNHVVAMYRHLFPVSINGKVDSSRGHLGSPAILVGSVLLIIFFLYVGLWFCVLFVFGLCLVCPMLPVSGLSIPNYPFGFLRRRWINILTILLIIERNYSAIWLKQQFMGGQYVVSFRHITLIPSQPVFVLTHYRCVICGETWHTNLIFCGLTRPGFEPMSHCTRSEIRIHYTMDEVYANMMCIVSSMVNSAYHCFRLWCNLRSETLSGETGVQFAEELTFWSIYPQISHFRLLLNTQVSNLNLVNTTRFWNKLHQVRSKSQGAIKP